MLLLASAVRRLAPRACFVPKSLEPADCLTALQRHRVIDKTAITPAHIWMDEANRRDRSSVGRQYRLSLHGSSTADLQRELLQLLGALAHAAQATPLFTVAGQGIGVVTTYAEGGDLPPAEALHMLDQLVLHAGCLLERLQQRKAVAAALRRKDEFLATVAHELRNSLAPLRTSVEILKMAKLDDPMLARARGILDRRLETVGRLTDDLMDASRIARGKFSMRTEDTSLNAILDNAAETVLEAMQQRRHDLAVKAQEETILVHADRVRLTQAFVNLLDNSAKYTPAGGRIEVRVSADREAVKIEVSDTGIGFSSDAIPLFELFSQDPSSRGHQNGGLGIGLALVKAIVEMHGGSVTASSPGAGCGSTFTVRLPRVSPDRHATTAARATQLLPSPGSLFSLRVVIADDNADAAESLASLLQFHGHQPRIARDGAEAVAITRDFHPDLVLMDVSMPGMDGIEAAEHIRQLPLPRQPEIIELTASASEVAGSREQAAGITERLAKPVSVDTLETIVASIESKVNAMGETSTRFLISNLEVALSLLPTHNAAGGAVPPGQFVERARLAYQRGEALLQRLSSDPQKREFVREQLRLLGQKLRAAGEIL